MDQKNKQDISSPTNQALNTNAAVAPNNEGSRSQDQTREVMIEKKEEEEMEEYKEEKPKEDFESWRINKRVDAKIWQLVIGFIIALLAFIAWSQIFS